jgi:ATP-binding cassette subfamily F protein 1
MKDINIHIENLSIGGKLILHKTDFIISSNKKYGLIGKNGIGKSTIINYIIKQKELNDVTTYLVSQELHIDDDITVFELILQSNKKIYDLHKSLELIEDEYSDEYCEIIDKLDDLDYEKEKSKIYKILFGLGFNSNQCDESVKTFSGGWRMRISLGRALYITPELLILDEPTNHLDLEGNIWLCNYLQKYKNTLILISHDIEFLDEVCTNIIHIENLKLNYYKGGYYVFQTIYEKEKEKIEKLYEECEKKINAYKRSGKTKNEINDFIKKNPLPELNYEKPIRIDFGEIPEDMKNLILLNNVSFCYDDKIILDNINFSVDASRHIALVGKNGGGKSTLMKLMVHELKQQSGDIILDRQIRIGYFNQHTIENLPLDTKVIDYLKNKFNDYKEQEIREYLGRIGLKSNEHTLNIGVLSGGQKIRIALVELQMIKPHVLLLDEPTNHLDIKTIESLKIAINNFNGGVIIITHNIDLITQTECDVWKIPECKKINYDDYIDDILNQ